jgi:hypothetical protein
MKTFLAALFRPVRKPDACADLMPLDDAWLREAAAEAAAFAARSARVSLRQSRA